MYAAHTGRTLETINKENEDGIFLGTVHASAYMVSLTGSPWVVDLTLNGHSVLLQFKLDSGANIKIIEEIDYNEARDGPLQSSKTILSSPSQMPPEVAYSLEILKLKFWIISKFLFK